ncbi:P44/Msp2 family outer membrane protein, partial [Anaplasma phagocytophilum]|uniref:P44/Msp2 family outer membrane protein n=1 Tax=Anaplasma phagocytophilum TaxID=948 RepID=UPI0009BE25CA
PDPRIGFKDNMLVAMEGSVGYGIGGARVELEIGYERFKTKGIRDSGSKEDEADTVYLLAKELAYDVVTDQEKRLGIALGKYGGKDIVRFADAVKISHPKIDEKVCHDTHAKGKDGGDNDATGYGHKGQTLANTKTAQCSGLAKAGATAGEVGLYKFVVNAKVGDGETWPTGYKLKNTTIDTKGEANSNADAVAKDLVALNREEKIKVAGLLAKTIEGGEVVEIRAVSSTFIRIRDELLSLLPLLTWGWKIVHSICAVKAHYSSLIS